LGHEVLGLKGKNLFKTEFFTCSASPLPKTLLKNQNSSLTPDLRANRLEFILDLIKFSNLLNRTDELIMKDAIHPKYGPVIIEDVSVGKRFFTKSTLSSNEKVTWEDGNSYPLIRVEVSAASHPFYTGEKLLLDTAGRVENFNKKFTKIATNKRKTRKAPNESK